MVPSRPAGRGVPGRLSRSSAIVVVAAAGGDVEGRYPFARINSPNFSETGRVLAPQRRDLISQHQQLGVLPRREHPKHAGQPPMPLMELASSNVRKTERNTFNRIWQYKST
jgi:hypothetical protein